MQSSVVVVANVAVQVLPELSDRLESPSMNALGLERVKERLHVGILIRSAATSHALTYAMVDQVPTERRPQELAAPVAVKDQSLGRLSPPERSLEGRVGEA